MKSIWFHVALSSTLVMAFACSSGSSGGGASSCASSAFNQSGTSSACTSCAENSCGSQLSALESACSDFLSCICPSGTYNASLEQQCSSKAAESGCQSASQAMGTCVDQKCSTCTSGGSSGGGSGGGSGSSSGGTGSSSGGTGGMVWCSFSGVVCENLPESTACTQTMGTVVSGCPSAGLTGCCTKGTEENCYYDAAITESSCTMSGGTWSTTWSPTP